MAEHVLLVYRIAYECFHSNLILVPCSAGILSIDPDSESSARE